MVADDPALEDLVFGADGIASALKAGCIHVSHSTISTALSRRLAAEHAHRNQGYVSAPVFGRDAAENRKLLIAAAGPPDLLDRCRPLFDATGRRTCVVGDDPWQANAVKLCGNFTVASLLEASEKPMRHCEKPRSLPKNSSTS